MLRVLGYPDRGFNYAPVRPSRRNSVELIVSACPQVVITFVRRIESPSGSHANQPIHVPTRSRRLPIRDGSQIWRQRTRFATSLDPPFDFWEVLRRGDPAGERVWTLSLM